MSLKGVLDILAERGLSLRLGPDGAPVIVGDREEATAALMEAVKAYRGEIVASLKATGVVASPAPERLPRQFLFRAGEVIGEERFRPDDERIRLRDCWPWAEDYCPFGALWWRREGEPGWRPVPGRGGEGVPVPPVKGAAHV